MHSGTVSELRVQISFFTTALIFLLYFWVGAGINPLNIVLCYITGLFIKIDVVYNHYHCFDDYSYFLRLDLNNSSVNDCLVEVWQRVFLIYFRLWKNIRVCLTMWISLTIINITEVGCLIFTRPWVNLFKCLDKFQHQIKQEFYNLKKKQAV